jgi:hypothetical protein
MNLEIIPRLALTHLGAILGGFLLAMWCMRTTETTYQSPKERPGFTITLKATKDSSADVSSVGKKTDLWIHHRFNSAINGPCISKPANLQTRQGIKFLQIFGDLNQLQNISPFLSDLQSGQAWIIKPSNQGHLPDCGQVPTVEYGSNP